MTKQTNIDVVAAVDRLGVLAAEIAELTAQEAVLKEDLAKLGDGAYEGTTFRTTVSVYVQGRLNMDAVKAKLSRQFLKANTTLTTVTKVVTKAKIRDAARAVITPAEALAPPRCKARHPLGGRCALKPGHKGNHVPERAPPAEANAQAEANADAREG